MLNNQIEKSMIKVISGDKGDSDILKMIQEMAVDMPLRQLGMMSQGALSVNRIEGLVQIMNGHILKGIRELMKK